MKLTRRDALLGTLFGAGMIGLRSAASGLPAAFIANPRRALAQVPAEMCSNAAKAQYVIFSTSAQGDPINTNAPGTYIDTNIVHPQDPTMAPKSIMVGGTSWQAATPWSTLGATLGRTTFFHLMTNTPIHPKEHDVLDAVGRGAERGHVRRDVSVAPREAARALPRHAADAAGIDWRARDDHLRGGGAPDHPTHGARSDARFQQGALGQLQKLRAQTLDTAIMPIYRDGGASPAQLQYIDSLVTSQQQMQGIQQSLLTAITGLKDNSVASQIAAAVALIQMKVSPVLAIHIPFGSDNHPTRTSRPRRPRRYPAWPRWWPFSRRSPRPTSKTKSRFCRSTCSGAPWARTTTAGRNHNGNHQLSLAIGKPFKSAVIGGVAQVAGDYGAVDIDATSGAPTPGGNIKAIDTMTSFAKSVMTAFGGDPTVISQQITGGAVVPAMIA